MSSFQMSSRKQNMLMNRWCESSEYSDYRRSRINPFLANIQHTKRRGFTVNQYRSGEVTGAIFQTGCESFFVVPRSGPIETECITRAGKTKIRRAIQNAETEFRCFLTVTFDPTMSKQDETGKVCQKWGKEKFKKFIHAIKVSCDRRAELASDENKRIAYVWVAELQENGNIHFHVMMNQRLPILWLTKLWKQASNSIDVRSIQSKNHASCYMRKYISKGQSIISGNRYGISQNLRETMKPMKLTSDGKKERQAIHELLEALKEDIELNGGKVIDCGFYIPPPTRSVTYMKAGKIRKTKSVNGQIGPFIINEVKDIIDPIPF